MKVIPTWTLAVCQWGLGVYIMAHGTQRTPSLPMWLTPWLTSWCWLLAGSQYPSVAFLWGYPPGFCHDCGLSSPNKMAATVPHMDLLGSLVHYTVLCWSRRDTSDSVWEGTPGTCLPPGWPQLTLAALYSSWQHSALSCFPDVARKKRQW